MHTTRIFQWTCGTLLAAAILMLVAPAAEARYEINYDATQGHELVAVRNLAGCVPYRHDPYDGAASQACQALQTLVGRAREDVFAFGVSASFNGPNDYAHVTRSLYINRELASPPHGRAAPPQERTYAGQHHFSHAAGGAAVAVGGGTYRLDVRGTVDLDYAFTGRAFARSDTALAGQLDTRMRLDFVMELPDDIMIEDGREIGRSLTERKVQGPPAHFVSRLSCDIQTTDEELTGSWCRLQQAAWAWRLRLLREDRAGSLTGTDVTTLMDQDFRAVDEYLFDRRAKAVP